MASTRNRMVKRRRWLRDDTFVDVACDRMRLSDRQQTAEEERVERTNEVQPVPVSCRQSAVSFCIDGFETRF